MSSARRDSPPTPFIRNGLTLALTAALALAAHPASAQVPSPAHSSVPDTATVGPSGICCFDIVVRDVGSNPIPGALVTTDFVDCPSGPNPFQPPPLQVAGTTVRAFTDAAGRARFCIRFDASIPACNVRIQADGVLLRTVPLDGCRPASGDSCTAVGWRDLDVVGPAARDGSALVRHETRGSLFLYGGTGGSGELNDTWEWDGEAWSQQGGGLQFARRDHAMAYDRARDRIVLFGGAVLGAFDGTTWEWSAGTGWVHVTSSGPSPRSGHVMAYDENLGRVILFGGQSQTGPMGDTWSWNGTSWTLVTSSGPSPRLFAAVASDPERARITLFGGSSTLNASTALSDTWEWDGAQWTEVSAVGPVPRRKHSMVFAPPSSRVVLFGGQSSSGTADPTTWSWNGLAWRAEPVGPAVVSPVAAYDFTRSLVTSFGGLRQGLRDGTTSQLCCLCDDEPIETDGNENPIPPPTWDPTGPVVDEIVEEDLGDVATRYPNEETDADSWLKNYPCPAAVGDDVPEDVLVDALDDSLATLGISATADEMGDSLDAWAARIRTTYGDEANVLANAPPVGFGEYSLPPRAWCPADSGEYIFGGRDIVFIHGLMLDHVFQKLLGNQGAQADWIPPSLTESAESQNPGFYTDTGFYRAIALQNWGEHIASFFQTQQIKNRYVIVSYPCNDRLDVGIQAVLTQINDAMRSGTNVFDPNGGDGSDFGTPSFVIVSHSTGGLLGAVAMHAARTYTNLNAEFIAERCKAHVALAPAFSGSQLATAALAAGQVFDDFNTSPDWVCELFTATMEHFGVELPDCPMVETTLRRSVLIDLVPPFTKHLWGEAIETAGIPTVLLTGAHPTHIAPLKNLLHRGFDDGVLTSNCTSANPAEMVYWPSGFTAEDENRGVRKTYDRGMAYKDDSKKRAKKYFRDQVKDPRRGYYTGEMDHYVASGPIAQVSPTGMLQSVGEEFTDPLLMVFNPEQRYTGYYTFMSSAAEHPGIRSGQNRPDYKLTDDIRNWEESRVLREQDLPAFRERHTPGPPSYVYDDQPLLTASCTPRVREQTIGRRWRFRIKIFNFKTFEKSGWIWKRKYMRPVGTDGRHIVHFAHESILACEPIAPWCDAVIPVEPGAGLAADVTVSPNPAGGPIAFSFTAARRGFAELMVFDANGRTVRRLLAREVDAGAQRVVWDGRDQRGGRTPAGVYFWRLRLDGEETGRRVVVVR